MILIKTILEAESLIDYHALFIESEKSIIESKINKELLDVLCSSVVRDSFEIDISIFIVFTHTGLTSFQFAR